MVYSVKIFFAEEVTYMRNISLTLAKKRKNDKFYTQLSDIENELIYYKKHFKGRTVFCNCDAPEYSNF